jgi:4-amino-4-deoxy-L-arabinose transferase-like glycosyltransferase
VKLRRLLAGENGDDYIVSLRNKGMRLPTVISKAATSLLLIVLVALGARMGFAWSQARKMPAQALGVVPFQNEAGNIAYALAAGKGFSNVFRMDTGPTAWLAPVYPIILGAVFRLCGVFTPAAFFAAVMFNILCSAAMCVPVFLIGRRVWSVGVGAGAAWLWAVFPNGILIPFEWIWDTSLAAFLAAAILWATLELADSEKWSDWCAYGVLWGLALLTNPAIGVLLPFLLGWAAIRGRGKFKQRRQQAALAAAVTVLCCLPWSIRNYAAFHRWIPLRSNLPYELWSGNNDVFDPDARSGRRVMTRMEEVQRYAAVGEVAFMDEKKTLAWDFIRSHGGLEARLTWRRFLNFWVGSDAPLKNFVQTDSWLIRVILAANVLTACGAFLGIFALCWKTRSIGMAFPVAIYPVVFPLLYYVTHAQLRLRHPIDPAVMVLTAVAVAGVAERLTKRGMKQEQLAGS